jgi:hypothetical protein
VTKQCYKCKEIKSVEMFDKNKNQKGGFSNECKACKSAYNALWYAIPANKAKRLAKVRITGPVWKRANAESVRIQRVKDESKRNALKRGNTIEPLPKNWWQLLLNFYGAACMKCGAVNKLTHDHVIPIFLGGPEAMSNFQILCRSCNCKKGSRSCADYRNGRIFTLKEAGAE